MEIKQKFQSSIDVLDEKFGSMLPNKAEHFGYRDGVSQPALRCVSTLYATPSTPV